MNFEVGTINSDFTDVNSSLNNSDIAMPLAHKEACQSLRVRRSQFDKWTPVLVHKQTCEILWRRHPDVLLAYDALPQCGWFGRFDHGLPGSMMIAVGYLGLDQSDQVYLYLNNGRHRTRWLLQQDSAEVPIALAPEDLQQARNAGLVMRILKPDEAFKLGVSLSASKMDHSTQCYCGFGPGIEEPK